MEIPFVFKGQQEFMKMKDTVNCYKLYPMIQSVLGINYPILIFYQKRRITKSTLLPESEIAFLTHLNVYDVSSFTSVSSSCTFTFPIGWSLIIFQSQRTLFMVKKILLKQIVCVSL